MNKENEKIKNLLKLNGFNNFMLLYILYLKQHRKECKNVFILSFNNHSCYC